jgi:hypothetical protein
MLESLVAWSSPANNVSGFPVREARAYAAEVHGERPIYSSQWVNVHLSISLTWNFLMANVSSARRHHGA